MTPNHPVWVNRLDGHMALANSAALKAAGVTQRDEGHRRRRDRARLPRGEPTGLLKDNAMVARRRRRCRRRRTQMRCAALDGGDEVRRRAGRDLGAQHGLVGRPRRVRARAARPTRSATRIYGVVPLAEWETLRDVVAQKEYGGSDGRGDEWLRVGGLKGFVDGSLGSHTAAFQEPFDDAPKDRGLLVNTPRISTRGSRARTRPGLQVMVHAIGDRAISLLLDIYERVDRRERPARPALPHRARAAPRGRRHPALREARRHRRACSRITPSTTAGGPRRYIGAARSRRRMRFARCSMPARRWRSAATGSSRRRRRSRGSTPR